MTPGTEAPTTPRPGTGAPGEAKVRPFDAPFATVPTAHYKLAQTVAGIAVRESDMAGFFGEPGTGKTYALSEFCRGSAVESVYVTATPSPTRKEIFEEILRGVGVSVADASARELRHRCEEVLSETPRIVVIDECQHLSYVWHQQLRALHDRPDARFALLLAGGANAVRVLKRDQQLASRVSMQVHFAPLGGQELLEVLHAFHPVLANTSDELLVEIDRKDCRGNLRRWHTFTRLSLNLLPQSSTPDRLSRKVVRAVLTLRGES